jgi:ribonuclease T
MNELYISVDIEASGPIPGSFSMLSIGASIVGQPGQKFYEELKPISRAFLPKALKITGRTFDYFVKVGTSPSQAMRNFNDWIVEVAIDMEPIFVGFNAPFDWSFINWYFHEFLGANPFGIGGIDIKAYYMGLMGCSWSETASSKIPTEFKGESPHTHNALDDAIEQAEMFALMLARNNKNNEMND